MSVETLLKEQIKDLKQQLKDVKELYEARIREQREFAERTIASFSEGFDRAVQIQNGYINLPQPEPGVIDYQTELQKAKDLALVDETEDEEEDERYRERWE